MLGPVYKAAVLCRGPKGDPGLENYPYNLGSPAPAEQAVVYHSRLSDMVQEILVEHRLLLWMTPATCPMSEQAEVPRPRRLLLQKFMPARMQSRVRQHQTTYC